MKQLITKVNKQTTSYKSNQWIVIHYTANNGDTALNNCKYFYDTYRGASAHYFVDENEVCQCVEDKDVAWHVGASQYYNDCRNINSIGIELCSRRDEHGYYFKKETVDNAVELTKYLMKKYDIDIDHVVRHYDVTHKICPEPFVRDEKAWLEFKSRLEDKMFDINQEFEALDFLVEHGIISNKEFWEKAMETTYNVDHLIIKFANYVKKAENG